MATLLQFPPREPQKIDDHSFYDFGRAARLTLVPPSTLSRWVHTGIASASRRLVDPDSRVIAEGFSFADLGYLHLLRHLRKFDVPMENAVEFMVHLTERLGPPSPKWKDARVFVQGRRVYCYQEDDWGYTEAVRVARHGSGQRLIETLYGPAFANLRERADSVLIPPKFSDSVEIEPTVADGMPVITTTAIQTATIRNIASDTSPQNVIQLYPFLTPHQIEDAVRFEEYLDTRAA